MQRDAPASRRSLQRAAVNARSAIRTDQTKEVIYTRKSSWRARDAALNQREGKRDSEKTVMRAGGEALSGRIIEPAFAGRRRRRSPPAIFRSLGCGGGTATVVAAVARLELPCHDPCATTFVRLEIMTFPHASFELRWKIATGSAPRRRFLPCLEI